MKVLPIALITILLAGCASTGMNDTSSTSSTSGMSGTSGTSGAGFASEMDRIRHPQPGDTYFGG
jgi:hypothetical protein